MIPLSNASPVKGFLFAGCSFTWGQGLYYYSNLPTLKEPPPDEFRASYVTEAHKRYMASVRFPRLVANHFNTWEVVHPLNSGSNYSAVHWWHSSFNTTPLENSRYTTNKSFDYTEFRHVFFQLTQWHRDNFIFEVEGEQYNILLDTILTKTDSNFWFDKFHRWLKEKSLTFEQWIEIYIDENIARVKKLLENFESNGVPTTIILWPEYDNYKAKGDEYISRIQRDPWLDQRLLRLKYQGNTYNSMEALMKEHPEMTIKYDYSNFIDPPKDHHPSLKCHRVMAENIIEHLTKLECSIKR